MLISGIKACSHVWRVCWQGLQRVAAAIALLRDLLGPYVLGLVPELLLQGLPLGDAILPAFVHALATGPAQGPLGSGKFCRASCKALGSRTSRFQDTGAARRHESLGLKFYASCEGPDALQMVQNAVAGSSGKLHFATVARPKWALRLQKPDKNHVGSDVCGGRGQWAAARGAQPVAARALAACA